MKVDADPFPKVPKVVKINMVQTRVEASQGQDEARPVVLNRTGALAIVGALNTPLWIEGLCICCQRDIAMVRQMNQVQVPGSERSNAPIPQQMQPQQLSSPRGQQVVARRSFHVQLKPTFGILMMPGRGE
ncbi:hypothetical protein Dimus_038879 [Dionaea muscipula]